jgi:hypothetical protein
MSKQTAHVKMIEQNGGSGAAEYMQQVAGDMNAQVAGPNGSLQYSRVSGGGLEQMAVPALLLLANNAAPKYLRRNASTLKRGGRRRRGGDVAAPVDAQKHGIMTPLSAVTGIAGQIVNNHDNNKPIYPIPNKLQGVAESEGRSKSAIFGRDAVSYENDTNINNVKGGNMLQQMAVPVTLMVANQMFGKRSSKKYSGGKKSKKSKGKRKGGKSSKRSRRR